MGAARHKGFIPWDDDIDVGMPIEDYLKPQEILNDGVFLPEPYFAASPYLESSPNFHCPFMKIYDGTTFIKQDVLSVDIGFKEGLWIDVFPLIGFRTQKDVKAVEQTFYSLYAKARLASERLRPGNSFTGTLGRFACFLPFRIRGVRHYLELYCAEEKQHSPLFNNNSFALQPTQSSKVFPVEVLKAASEIEFEGKFYPAPANYEIVLTISYGDWKSYLRRLKECPARSAYVAYSRTKPNDWCQGFVLRAFIS